MKEKYPQRLVTVAWGNQAQGNYRVQLHLEAIDRPGLLKEITHVLLAEKLSIISLRSSVDQNEIARISLSFIVQEKDQLSRVNHLLRQVPKVLEVRR